MNDRETPKTEGAPPRRSPRQPAPSFRSGPGERLEEIASAGPWGIRSIAGAMVVLDALRARFLERTSGVKIVINRDRPANSSASRPAGSSGKAPAKKTPLKATPAKATTKTSTAIKATTTRAATKQNAASQNAASQNAASQNAASQNAASQNAAKRTAPKGRASKSVAAARAKPATVRHKRAIVHAPPAALLVKSANGKTPSSKVPSSKAATSKARARRPGPKAKAPAITTADLVKARRSGNARRGRRSEAAQIALDEKRWEAWLTSDGDADRHAELAILEEEHRPWLSKARMPIARRS